MGFLKGAGAVRRSVEWLQRDKFPLKSHIKAVAFQWNASYSLPSDSGLS